MTETYVIHTTKKCNMKCKYCYESDKSSEYEWESIKSYLTDLISKSEKSFTIEFLGGEPMLEWENIRKTYEFLESVEDKTVNSYTITTNGTILTPEQLDYMSKNKKFNFAVSLDGHKYANQLRTLKDGTNSYDVAMLNLKRAQKAKINTSVHIVTHPYNIGMLYDSINDLYKNNIRNIGIGTIESTIIIDRNYCDRFIKECNRISDSIVSGKFKGLNIGELNHIKPKEDVRCYIKDKNTGKTIGESYGRVKDDVSYRNDKYEIIRCEDKNTITMMIEYIRESIFNYHQKNININK